VQLGVWLFYRRPVGTRPKGYCAPHTLLADVSPARLRPEAPKNTVGAGRLEAGKGGDLQVGDSRSACAMPPGRAGPGPPALSRAK